MSRGINVEIGLSFDVFKKTFQSFLDSDNMEPSIKKEITDFLNEAIDDEDKEERLRLLYSAALSGFDKEEIYTEKKRIREKGNSTILDLKDYVVIDTETTGLDYNSDSLIEVAGLKVKDGKVVAYFSELIKPAYYTICDEDIVDYCVVDGQKVRYVDSFITSLTGITNRMLENARSEKEVLSEFLNFIGENIVIGHNVNFDINFIYDAAELSLGQKFSNDFIDTLRVARKVLKNLKHHRLSDLAEYYNIPQMEAHRALGDCFTTIQVYSCLLKDVYAVFGSIEEIQKTFKKHSSAVRAKQIVAQKDLIDEDSPIYNKTFVFTGTLEKFDRKNAMQLVVNYGGHCADSVTKKVNYLVVGGYREGVIKEGKSNKQKKAEEYKEKGYDIEIISEYEFYRMAEE